MLRNVGTHTVTVFHFGKLPISEAKLQKSSSLRSVAYILYTYSNTGAGHVASRPFAVKNLDLASYLLFVTDPVDTRP